MNLEDVEESIICDECGILFYVPKCTIKITEDRHYGDEVVCRCPLCKNKMTFNKDNGYYRG